MAPSGNRSDPFLCHAPINLLPDKFRCALIIPACLDALRWAKFTAEPSAEKRPDLNEWERRWAIRRLRIARDKHKQRRKLDHGGTGHIDTLFDSAPQC